MVTTSDGNVYMVCSAKENAIHVLVISPESSTFLIQGFPTTVINKSPEFVVAMLFTFIFVISSNPIGCLSPASLSLLKSDSL
jgi:hypothetical protein